MTNHEPLYRVCIWLSFPARWRRRHGEALIDTLMEGGTPGLRATAAAVAGIVGGGIRVRVGLLLATRSAVGWNLALRRVVAYVVASLAGLSLFMLWRMHFRGLVLMTPVGPNSIDGEQRLLAYTALALVWPLALLTAICGRLTACRWIATAGVTAASVARLTVLRPDGEAILHRGVFVVAVGMAVALGGVWWNRGWSQGPRLAAPWLLLAAAVAVIGMAAAGDQPIRPDLIRQAALCWTAGLLVTLLTTARLSSKSRDVIMS